MKTIFLSLTLSILSFALYAQSIKGIVIDAHDHQALPYLSVSLLKADSSLIKGALTNNDGAYHLENFKAGKYLVCAQMVGYTKKLVPITIGTETQTVNIELVQESKQLGEVSIKASKPLVEHRADKLIFNVANSIVATGNNGMELLKMTPLVSIGPNNSITLKGKSNVMVMINGKIIPGETVDNLLQSMSAEQIARIEIITNPSAKYDASASGGIINIITVKGANMGLNGMANMAVSESKYTKYNGGVSLNYRDNKINIYGNVNFRDGKGYKNESLIRYLQSGNQPITLETPTELFSNGKAETGKIGIDYNLTKTSILGAAVDVMFLQSDNRAIATSYFRNAGSVLDSVLTSASKPGTHIQYANYDLNYKNTLNTKGEELTIDLTHSHYNGLTQQDVAAQMNYVSTPAPAEYSSSSTRTRAIFDITTFQTDYTLPITKATLLESGLKDLYTSSNNRSTNLEVNSLSNEAPLSETAYKENIAAGYLNLTQQLSTLKLQAGLRAEQTNAKLSSTGLNNSYLNFFPSALIEKKFSDKYQLSFTFASQINRPAYESLIPFVVPIDRYTQEKGNPNLKPEYSHSFELTNTFGSISFTLNYTHTRDAITDFIEQDEQTKVWTFTKANFARMENYSATLMLPFTVTKWWNTTNTLLGLYNSYYGDNVGGAVYNHGKFSYNLNSINTFTLPDGFRAELTGIYNAANVYGLYQISHYSMVNAGVSRAFLQKKLNVKVGVNDIFHSSGYDVNTNAGDIHMQGSSYTDSRKVTLSVSYKFGGKVAPARQRNQGNEDARGRLHL